MTREQEIKEMAKVKASHITSDKDMQVAFADALRSGAEWADRTMIDNACEWLTRELCYTAKGNNFFNNKTATDEFVESFKRAMKGGEK